MKITMVRVLGIVAIAGAVSFVGCGKTDDVGEKTGAAVDTAADKTAEGVKKAATATKDATGKAVEKTGEALKKAGKAVENTGTDMQE